MFQKHLNTISCWIMFLCAIAVVIICKTCNADSVTGPYQNQTDLNQHTSVFSTKATPFYSGKKKFLDIDETPVEIIDGKVYYGIDIDFYLQKGETREFFSTFDNIEKRNAVEQQLRSCPYTPLCTFSLNVTIPVEYYTIVPCCKDCRCDLSCQLLNDCCPDVISNYDKTVSRADQNELECSPLQLESSKPTSGIGGMMISRCKRGFGYHDICMCTRYYDEDISAFQDILLVTSKLSYITYRNKYCAYCNGVSDENLLYWQPQFQCDKNILRSYESEAEYIQKVFSDLYCSLKFYSNVARVEKCYFSTSECNKTSLWDQYNVTIERACLAYTSIVYDRDLTNRYYKNVFCSMCNGVSHPKTLCIDDASLSCGFDCDPRYDFPFSGLLRFDRDDASNRRNEESMVCDNDTIWDKYQGECKVFFCTDITRYADLGRCLKRFSTITNIVYQINVRLKPTDDLTILDAYVLADEIIPWFNSIIQESVVAIDTVDICIAQIMYVTSDLLNQKPEISDLINSTLMYYDVYFEIGYRQYHDSDEFVNKVTSIDGQQVVFDLSNENVNFTNETYLNINTRNITLVAFFRDEVNTSSHNSNQIILDKNLSVSENVQLSLVNSHMYKHDEFKRFYHFNLNDASKYISECDYNGKDVDSMYELASVNIVAMRECPMFTITNQSKFRWQDIVEGIIFMKTDYVLKSSKYIYFNESDQTIFVCVETFNKIIANLSINYIPIGLSGESIVSVISLSISIISLTVTLITYCMFEQLRTLPGKNNMSLSVNLLIAQILFLVVSLSQLEPLSIPCKTIGVAVHLFLLQSVFWMSICTYHTFRVFVKTKVMRHGNGRATLFKYHSVSTIASAICVSINIIYSVVKSEYHAMGYGKTVCYISTQFMQTLTFRIPVAVIVVTNMTMFSIVVVKIMRMPDISSTVKHKRNNVVIFAKLSTLTGLTWVFGFLYAFTGIQAFAYIFNVLAGGQGVLVMMSFIVNKRVLDMYKTRIFKTAQTSHSENANTFSISLNMS